MDPAAGRPWTTSQICDHFSVLASARTGKVDEVNVRDVDFARVRCARRLVDIEIALVKHQRCIRVLNMDVLVSNI